MKIHKYTATGIIVVLTIGFAGAATISYNFSDSGNITGSGTAAEAYSSPDVNDFGSGVTVGSFTMTEAVTAQYSRIDTNSYAGVQGRTNSFPQISFTVTIPTGVTVNLDSISFDHVANRTGGATNYTWALATSAGTPSVTSRQTTHDGGVDFQTLSNESLTLNGLTGLTGTSVTFSWTMSSSFATSYTNTSHGLDNIVIQGSVVPEPTSSGLLAGTFASMLLVRRRTKS